MNDKRFTNELNAALPETPSCFRNAMTQTLSAIVAQEAQETQMAQEAQTTQTAQEAQTTQAPRAARAMRAPRPVHTPHHSHRPLRRGLLLAAIIVLLLATVAVAAIHWRVFDYIWFYSGAPRNLDTVMIAKDIHREVVNGVEISIDEAGYDGRTLYLMYSYHFPDVDHPLGAYATGEAEVGVGDEDFALFNQYNVGWWVDHIWFNGKPIDMPTNSGGEYSGSPEPGVLTKTEYWRLDNVGVKLEGEVEIALPIGERQPLYYIGDRPEMFDENRMMLLRDKGMVTFTIDVGDIADRVEVEHPNIPVKTPLVTARATEVCYTPLLTYITLGMEVDPDAMAAFIAENGEGYYNEEGELLWPYGGMDVFDGWIYALTLVDGEGTVLFPDDYGNNGYGNEWAEYVYPSLETVPEELWLAPVWDGVVDMTQAVRVK